MDWLLSIAGSLADWPEDEAPGSFLHEQASRMWVGLALTASMAEHGCGSPPSAARVQSWRERLRHVLDLAAPASEHPDLRSWRLVARTLDGLHGLACAVDGDTVHHDGDPESDPESEGILTSLTRRLSPQRAAELYRKITPVCVYQLLNELDASLCLGVVRRIVEHLSSAAVQTKLRRCPHVRDAILEELLVQLADSGVTTRITRADLQRSLDRSGALPDLIAMENCLRLASGRSGRGSDGASLGTAV